ncbi:paramyosin [Schistosoma japonicum]|uniref:Paramyosin n=1 Tax=Schistosoma japonicum TaxID=6182 RepID=A0A4Z2CQG1_SCHJA|nr:paramyosin [Schistosoma japonicum]
MLPVDSLLVFDVLEESSLNSPNTHELRVIFLDTLVRWIYHFASSFRSSLNGGIEESSISKIVNNMIIETLCLIETLTDSLKSSSPEVHKPLMEFSSHLKFMLKTASKRGYSWVDYCCKLGDYCDKMSHCILFSNDSSLTLKEPSRGMLAATSNTSWINDGLCFSELRTLIERQMNESNENDENYTTSSSRLFNTIYKRACNKSNIMQIIQKIQTDYQDQNQQNSEDLSTLVRVQQHLLKLSSLFITWHTMRQFGDEISIKQAQTTDSYPEQSPSDTNILEQISLIEDNQNAHLNLKDSRKKRRKLVDKSCFDQFCGSLYSTPPSSPRPKKIDITRKYIINLPKENSKSRRTPWTVEESIALWHGVMHNPGSKNWSQIWRQSFRHSNRSQVNLKDRWRVIHDNQTIKTAIQQAYVNWVSQFTNKKDNPVKDIHLPMPIIVRTYQST